MWWTTNIYIYAFSRRFYPKRLTVHSDYTFVSVQWFPGNRTHNLCTTNAMLYHWATGTLWLTVAHCGSVEHKHPLHSCKSIPPKMFAFIIFNPNLKMLLPAKMMGFSRDISLTAWAWASLTPPLQLSVSNAYFTTSNQFAVEKNKPCPLFSPFNILVLSEKTSQYRSKTVANF